MHLQRMHAVIRIYLGFEMMISRIFVFAASTNLLQMNIVPILFLLRVDTVHRGTNSRVASVPVHQSRATTAYFINFMYFCTCRNHLLNLEIKFVIWVIMNLEILIDPSTAFSSIGIPALVPYMYCSINSALSQQ